jgi:hypothetical protein
MVEKKGGFMVDSWWIHGWVMLIHADHWLCGGLLCFTT